MAVARNGPGMFYRNLTQGPCGRRANVDASPADNEEHEEASQSVLTTRRQSAADVTTYEMSDNEAAEESLSK